MKIALIFLLLVVNLVVFGQSAKEENKTLKKDIELCKAQSIPLLENYQKKKSVKDSILGEVLQRSDLAIEAELPARELFAEIHEMINDLWLLRVDLKAVIDTGSLTPVVSFGDFTEDIYDLLNWEDRGVGILSETPYLKGLEIEEQNKILRGLYFECMHYTNDLEFRLYKIGPDQKRLEAFIPKLDSIILIHKSVVPELQAKKVKLEQKLQELRNDYSKNGPTGFSEGYRIVFPNIFISIDDGSTYDIEEAIERKDPSPKMDIYTIVDEGAQFPGGMPALKKYLVENIHYPEIAVELGG